MQMNPYLSFNGQCEEAFRFYEQRLGAKVEAMVTHEQTPMGDKVSPEWRKKIIHARLGLHGSLLMGGDVPPERYEAPKGFSLSIVADTPEEAERLFEALAEDGTVRIVLQQTFWAACFGMLVDRFGIPWMIQCEKSSRSCV